MYKNYKDNLYGAEQLEASYKRQSQPVEVAGEVTQKGGLKSKKSSSAAKAQKVLDNVDESILNEKSSLLNEEMENMKKLIGYQYKK
jgi:6-pyruvoyl-tetrahydropterin synthase